MQAATEGVITGEVTCAVRDSTTAAGAVRVGDWIGLVRGEGILSIAGSAREAAIDLLDRLVSDGAELVTVVTGAEADASETDALVAWLADAQAHVAVEVVRGDQPLYPYLFGIE
jgi:dihydroxyacetone kinase-like predicted kinase